MNFSGHISEGNSVSNTTLLAEALDLCQRFQSLPLKTQIIIPEI